MVTYKGYCKQNGLDPEKVFQMVFGETGGILPKGKGGFFGYMAEITDTSIICVNDQFGVKKEIPFSSFSEACFGIGSGNLWLQCVVDDCPFTFCSTRGMWKSPAGKLLLQKIGEYAQIEGMKEYKHFTGKLFLFYMLIR